MTIQTQARVLATIDIDDIATAIHESGEGSHIAEVDYDIEGEHIQVIINYDLSIYGAMEMSSDNLTPPEFDITEVLFGIASQIAIYEDVDGNTEEITIDIDKEELAKRIINIYKQSI